MTYFHEAHQKKKKHYGPRPDFPQADYQLISKMESYLFRRLLNFKLAGINGWYPTSEVDKYPRIVIPCSNSDNIPYWQARLMDEPSVKGHFSAFYEPTVQRYKSPFATREDSLVLVWPGLRATKGSCVVEGPTDALAAADCGYLGIGLMGNDPPPSVLVYLASVVVDFEPVILCPDLDHLEMGPALMGLLSSARIKTRLVTPLKKDLAAMAPRDRRQLLADK